MMILELNFIIMIHYYSFDIILFVTHQSTILIWLPSHYGPASTSFLLQAHHLYVSWLVLISTFKGFKPLLSTLCAPSQKG